MKLWPVSMSVPGSGDFFVDSSQRHRMSTKQGQVRIEYAVWKSQSWLTRLFSSFILSSSLSAVTRYRRNTLSLDRFNMDTCSLVDWPKTRFLADFIHNRRDLYCILTLCERWRREDETPHGVSGRGWHRRGQDASVRGGRPRQRAAGPSVCVTAQDRQPGLTTNIWTMIVWLTQTLFWR